MADQPLKLVSDAEFFGEPQQQEITKPTGFLSDEEFFGERVSPSGPVEQDSSFTGSVARGVDLAQGMGYSFIEASGEAMGSDTLKDFGKEGRERNMVEMGQNPRTQNFKDIGSFGDAVDWAKETAGEQAAMMAPSMAGGIGGAALGAATPIPGGAVIGGIIGAVVPSFILGTGETQMAIKEKDPNAEAPGMAFLGGSAIAALDSVLPGKLGSYVVKAYGRETAEAIVREALKKRLVKEIPKGMALEGVTEAVQEAISEAAAAHGTGQEIDWSGLQDQMIEAGAAGALMGGGATGATEVGTAIMQGNQAPTEQDLEDQINAERAKNIDEGVRVLSGEEVQAAPDVSPPLSTAQPLEDGLPNSAPLGATMPEGTGERHAPVKAEVPVDVDLAATQANTAPSDAQKEAGNYKKGHVKVQGLDIAIENPKGSVRSGSDEDGKAWETVMRSHYGYIKTAEGADGDKVDVFINTATNGIGETAFVVDQVVGGQFDEHKVVLGAESIADAKAIYSENYAPDWDGIGAVTPMHMDDFKTWLKDGNTKKPVAWTAPLDDQLPADMQPVSRETNQEQTPAFNVDAHYGAAVAFAKAQGKKLTPLFLSKALGVTGKEARALLDILAARGVIRKSKDKGTYSRIPVRKGPVDVLTYIADRGGLRDDEGHDLKKGRGGQRFIPGVGPLIRSSGHGVDALGEMLHEDGYFGPLDTTPRPTEAQVLEVLDRALSGEKVYIPEEAHLPGETRAAEESKAGEAEVRTRVSELELDLNDGEVSYVAGWVGQGMSLDDAIAATIEQRTGKWAEAQNPTFEDEVIDIPWDEIMLTEPADLEAGIRYTAPRVAEQSFDAPFAKVTNDEPRTAPQDGQPDQDRPGEARAQDRPEGSGRGAEARPEPGETGRAPAGQENPGLATAQTDQAPADTAGVSDSVSKTPKTTHELNAARDRVYRPDKKLYGYSSVDLSTNYTMEELNQLRLSVETDPANQEDTGLYLYTKPARSKLDKIAWAVRYKMEEKRKAAKATTETVTNVAGATEQGVIPGAEKISDKELAERKMAEKKKSDVTQKDAGSDGGLFDTGARDQGDLLDVAAKPVVSHKTENIDDKPKAKNPNGTDLLGDKAKITDKGVEMYAAAMPRGAAYTQLVADQNHFSSEVDDALAGKRKGSRAFLTVGETPLILNRLGVKRKKLMMRASKPQEILDTHDGMTIDLIKRAPTLISDPVMVMKSGSRGNPHALVAVLNEVDANGELLVAVVTPATGRVQVDTFSSAYGKTTNPQRFIDDAVAQKRVRYYNEEMALNHPGITGVQFPRWGAVKRHIPNVLSHDDFVKARAQKPDVYSVLGEYSWKDSVDRKKLVEQIIAIHKRIAPKTDIEVVEQLFGNIEGRGLEEVGGVYSPGKNLVRVAVDFGNAEALVRHEDIHALRDMGMFTKTEWNILSQKARRQWIEDYKIDVRYPKHSKEKAAEEAIGDAFADYMTGDARFSPVIRRIFDKIKQFFERLGNLLNGQGYQSVEDIFDRVERGDVGKRQANHDTDATSSIDDLYSVDEDPISELASSKDFAERAAETLQTPEQKQGALKTALDGVRDFVTSPAIPHAKDLNWFQKAMVHPRMIAEMFPKFTPVWLAAEKQFKRRDTINAELTSIMEPYHALELDSKARVHAVLELGRLQGEVIDSKNVGLTNTWGDTDMSKLGERINLTEDESKAYHAVRKTMDRVLQLYTKQVLNEWGYDQKDSPKTSAELEALSKELYEKAKDAESHEEAKDLNREGDTAKEAAKIIGEIEAAKATGYVPFSRFGDVGITVRDKGNSVVHFEKIEVGGAVGRLVNRKKVQDVRRRLMEQYPKSKGYAVGNAQQMTNAADMAAAGLKIGDIDALADIAGIEDSEWAGTREKLNKATMKAGFRKHFIGSKKTAGYSTDFERSLADSITSVSSYLARREVREEMEQAQAQLASPQNKQTNLYEYAKTYGDYVQSPGESLQWFRSLNFFYYLSGNVSSAVVNLTQVGLATAPYLTQFTSARRVSMELARAYKDVGKMAWRKPNMDGGAMEFFDPSKAPADVKEDLQRAWDDGTLVPLVTLEQMGVAHGREKFRRGIGKGSQAAVEFAGSLFTGAERANRLVTFIAAHRLARQKGFMFKVNEVLKDNGLWQHQAKDMNPGNFAEWAIDETHFVMGKRNRPTLFRGVGTAVFQFRGFSVQYLELMWRMASQNGAEGKRAFAMLLGGLVASAGVWGLPFGDDLKDVIEQLYAFATDREIDLEAELREAIYDTSGSALLAEAVNRGPMRMVGADMSHRIGMGSVLPMNTFMGLMGVQTRQGGEVMGVGWDMTVGRVKRIVDHLKNDQLAMAGSEALPAFAKNPVQSILWSTDGVRSRGTGRAQIPENKITDMDVALKWFGFTPVHITREREVEWAKIRSTRAVTNLQARFYTKMVRSIVEGDKDGVAALFAEIKDYNADKPFHKQIRLSRTYLNRLVRLEVSGYEGRKLPRKARPHGAKLDQVYPN